jgi:RNA polymerase sigma-70 factor (ECF subfamily)
MSLTKTSDELWQSEAADSAERLIEALVTEHYPFIWRLLRRLGLPSADAEDAAQEVFVILARKIRRVEARRARSFLYATALRVASNHRRGQRRRPDVPGDSDRAHAASADDPEQQFAVREACALLDDLLAQLPVPLRRALVLADVEELELTDIAALERIPRGTAASRVRLARRRFGELVERAAAHNPFGRSP